MQPVDRFTVAHACIGVALGLWGAPWWFAASTAIGWELVENGIKRAAPNLFPVAAPDTFANAAFDVVAWMAGWGAGRIASRGERAQIWKGSGQRWKEPR